MDSEMKSVDILPDSRLMEADTGSLSPQVGTSCGSITDSNGELETESNEMDVVPLPQVFTDEYKESFPLGYSFGTESKVCLCNGYMELSTYASFYGCSDWESDRLKYICGLHEEFEAQTKPQSINALHCGSHRQYEQNFHEKQPMTKAGCVGQEIPRMSYASVVKATLHLHSSPANTNNSSKISENGMCPANYSLDRSVNVNVSSESSSCNGKGGATIGDFIHSSTRSNSKNNPSGFRKPKGPQQTQSQGSSRRSRMT